MLFCARSRATLSAAEPGLSMGDTSKRLAEMWKAVSEEEKRPLVAAAQNEKTEYICGDRCRSRQRPPNTHALTHKRLCPPRAPRSPEESVRRKKGESGSKGARGADALSMQEAQFKIFIPNPFLPLRHDL